MDLIFRDGGTERVASWSLVDAFVPCEGLVEACGVGSVNSVLFQPDCDSVVLNVTRLLKLNDELRCRCLVLMDPNMCIVKG